MVGIRTSLNMRIKIIDPLTFSTCEERIFLKNWDQRCSLYNCSKRENQGAICEVRSKHTMCTISFYFAINLLAKIPRRELGKLPIVFILHIFESAQYIWMAIFVCAANRKCSITFAVFSQRYLMSGARKKWPFRTAVYDGGGQKNVWTFPFPFLCMYCNCDKWTLNLEYRNES